MSYIGQTHSLHFVEGLGSHKTPTVGRTVEGGHGLSLLTPTVDLLEDRRRTGGLPVKETRTHFITLNRVQEVED